MSKRPSASFNDPGYFYSQRKLLKFFAISSGVMMLGILAMIWQDFDRPWKDEQRAAMKWDASRAALENMILETLTAKDRKAIAAAREKAKAELKEHDEELAGIRAKLPDATGAFAGADMEYKAQKQFTGEAEYRFNEAKTAAERQTWAKRLREERDKEYRLRDAVQLANERMSLLLHREKELQAAVDAVVVRERGNPLLKRMGLLAATVEKKRSYNPLREIPLLDFLAPPTKVEQIVLEDLVDNYEFSMPKKVDRCGTCHTGAMRIGYEPEKWPADPDPRQFEQGVYRFVFDLLDAVTPKIALDGKYPRENGLLREKDLHHATLSLLFKGYDEESGEIDTQEVERDGKKQTEKIWRRWVRGEDGEWKEDDHGASISEYYLHLLQRIEPQQRTHPHFNDMVGDTSPHPYEKIGCQSCHLGRGWSVDFGFAFHTPDRKKIDAWMTDKWIEEHGHHAKPTSADRSFEEAMAIGNDEARYPVNVGWTLDHERGHEWEQDLGWTHEKLHYWDWPQHPKMLVQASCLKCHKEGLYKTPAVEYEGVHLGKPDPKAPDILDWEEHARAKSYDADADAAGEYVGRMFIPEKEKPYEPKNLDRGMDDFLRFGCYGCHKLDPAVYPFMKNVRARFAPPLDEMATKASREFFQKWVRNPKDFRPGTRMPSFFGLSNNPDHFSYRFAGRGDDQVDGQAWQEAEIYAITEWILDESKSRARTYEAIDLSRGDAARGARIVLADSESTDAQAKACIACHDVPVPDEIKVDPGKLKAWNDKISKISGGWGARMSRRQGPNLEGLGSKVNKDWLYHWLKDPRGYWHDSNMPNLRLTDQEALDVTAFLMTLKHDEFEKLPAVGKNDIMMLLIAQELKVAEQQQPTDAAVATVNDWTPRERELYVGKKLVKHYGCFGCHQIETYKNATPIGTELTEWGSKLIDRLAFNHAPIDQTRFDFAYTKLINPRVYDVGMATKDRPLDRLKMPRFGLAPEEARDISTFLVGLVIDPVERAAFEPDAREEALIRGRQVIRRYNCQGCHMIEGKGGDIWSAIDKVNFRPPDLLGQGQKTNPAWLFKFMKDPAFVLSYSPAGEDRVRPWHSVRMPTFELTDEEARAVVRYFAALSNVTSDFESPPPDELAQKGEGYPKSFIVSDPTDAEGKRKLNKTAYSRLDETDAMFIEYKCKSCHFNDPVSGKASAPNFRHTRNGRLRGVWVERWLWGPYKLQAGTQMPTFFGKDKAAPQDKRFFQTDPQNPDTDGAKARTAEAQVRALRDYIRYHYKDE